jgi:uncharacterized protein YehS (DUF1456 family)
MINNDVLRSLRFMLKTDDTAIAAMIALGGGTTSRPEVTNFLKRDDEEGYAVCDNRVMAQFLDGLIIHRRGIDQGKPPRPPEKSINNNTVLKKLRVAFELKEDDILSLMASSGFEVSKPELSALFRNGEHKNFRPAGDQFLRNFLKGLTARLRG